MPSNKERVWLEEYFRCGFNATEAARRAGYAHPNKRGPEKIAKFAEEIAARLDEMAMSADEALARISEMARGEWGKYVTEAGVLDIVKLVADGKGYLVKKVRETKDGREYEFYDAQRALETMAKHHGLLVERAEITGAAGGPLIIEFVNDWRGAREEE
jgi:phage terminase small subunit